MSFLIFKLLFPLYSEGLHTAHTWVPFLESPDNQRARKAVVVSMQGKVSIVLNLTK